MLIREFISLFQLSTCLNELDSRGELALDLALKDRQMGIARTLIEHNADPDARDTKGWTIFLRAVERGGYLRMISYFFAENFILFDLQAMVLLLVSC